MPYGGVVYVFFTFLVNQLNKQKIAISGRVDRVVIRINKNNCLLERERGQLVIGSCVGARFFVTSSQLNDSLFIYSII